MSSNCYYCGSHPDEVVDLRRRRDELEFEIERMREALKFARKRLEYYGTISDRRHFDHDLVEVYPKIDAALISSLRKVSDAAGRGKSR